MKRLAKEIRPGDTVTYSGATFKAAGVTSGPEDLLKVTVVGAAPQFIWAEREVDIRRPAPVDPKPFKAYTRDYDAEGNCDKRIFSFATEAARSRFLSTTKRCVTFTN